MLDRLSELPVAGSFEDGNEILDSITGREYIRKVGE
jgi:hypothetical protein